MECARKYDDNAVVGSQIEREWSAEAELLHEWQFGILDTSSVLWKNERDVGTKVQWWEQYHGTEVVVVENTHNANSESKTLVVVMRLGARARA